MINRLRLILMAHPCSVFLIDRLKLFFSDQPGVPKFLLKRHGLPLDDALLDPFPFSHVALKIGFTGLVPHGIAIDARVVVELLSSNGLDRFFTKYQVVENMGWRWVELPLVGIRQVFFQRLNKFTFWHILKNR